MNTLEKARDLHYKLIEDYGLIDSGNINAEVRDLIVQAIRSEALTTTKEIIEFHARGGCKMASEWLKKHAKESKP